MVSHLSSSDFFSYTDLCSSWARVDCVDSSWISFCEEDLAVRRAYWASLYLADERCYSSSMRLWELFRLLVRVVMVCIF